MIPKGWQSTELGELVNHKKGFAFKAKDFNSVGGRRVIRVSDTSATSIKSDDPIFMDESKAIEYDDYKLLRGDIILTTVGSRPPLYDSMVGKTIRVPGEIEGALLNQNLVKLAPKNGELASEFLYELLKTQRFQYHIVTSARGNANQASITLDDVFAFPVTLPTLPEQKKIAEILSTWDRAIELLNKQLALKKARIRRHQSLLFIERAEKSKWLSATMGAVCSKIVDGTHFTPDYRASGVPFLSVESVTTDSYTDTKYISTEEHQKISARCKPQRGDILLTRIGTLGITKMIDWDHEVSIYVSLALLRPNEMLDASFLYRFTKSEKFIKELKKRSLLNAAPQKINLQDIAHIPLKYPKDRKEQKTVANFLTSASAEIESLVKIKTRLQKQKQGLMQKLLTGKMRVKV